MDISSIVNTDWDSWKRNLRQAVEFAEEIGISREQIHNLAQEAGDILARNVPPANPEQQAMKELWEVAGADEKHVLAGLITKLALKK